MEHCKIAYFYLMHKNGFEQFEDSNFPSKLYNRGKTAYLLYLNNHLFHTGRSFQSEKAMIFEKSASVIGCMRSFILAKKCAL